MDVYGEENPHCYFHPKEVVVGVCALCLKERLLTLASLQDHLPAPKATHRSNKAHLKKLSITFPKVFALGYFRHHRRKSDSSDQETYFTSHEDSFISIKFEEDGRASWAHKTSSRPSSEPSNIHFNHKMDKETKMSNSLVEHEKYPPALRWRKRIGRIFHLIPWKKSTKTNTCHMGSKAEGVRLGTVASVL
ncbi:uncharacterized protein LOC131237510 [Magnolia sinica]|uniref:uncharacterized protein LOC131237510 n=1 Tax=Magnolia sinica TaxID=86752 RepID=UPI002659DBA3|nr:uncharacterized protein LOC131237510 [Magnolia sinica]